MVERLRIISSRLNDFSLGAAKGLAKCQGTIDFQITFHQSRFGAVLQFMTINSFEARGLSGSIKRASRFQSRLNALRCSCRGIHAFSLGQTDSRTNRGRPDESQSNVNKMPRIVQRQPESGRSRLRSHGDCEIAERRVFLVVFCGPAEIFALSPRASTRLSSTSLSFGEEIPRGTGEKCDRGYT